jgi:hypothetical protein
MTDEQRALLDWVLNNESLIRQGMLAEARSCREVAESAKNQEVVDVFIESWLTWNSKASQFEKLVDAACD